MIHLTRKDIRGQKQNLALVESAIEHNLFTLLVGETGTGKTSIVHAVANDLGRKVTRVNLTGQTGEDELAGKMGLLNAETFFTDGPLTTAVREGHVLILDEINAANAEVLFLLHPLLDDGRFIRLMGKDGEIVPAHSDFRLFATMNPPEYVGTKELNPAFLSRFHLILSMNFPKPSDEAKILIDRNPKLPEASAVTMIEFATHIRKAYNGGEMLTIVSTRDLLSWASLSVILDSMPRAFEPALLNRSIQSKTDRERMKAEFKRISKDIEGLNDIPEPLSLITEAMNVRAEQQAKLLEIETGLRALDEKERQLAKAMVGKFDKFIDAVDKIPAGGIPTNGAAKMAPANNDSVESKADEIRALLLEKKTVQQVALIVEFHYTTIYNLIRAHGGRAAFLAEEPGAVGLGQAEVETTEETELLEYGKSVGLRSGDGITLNGLTVDIDPLTPFEAVAFLKELEEEVA